MVTESISAGGGRNLGTGRPNTAVNPTNNFASDLAPSDADRRQSANALNAARNGNIDEATRSAENIQNARLRNLTLVRIKELNPEVVANAIASSQFPDGVVGVNNPEFLFFMMVFYLNQRSPQINWNDILESARRVTGSNNFQSITNNEASFPIPGSTIVETISQRIAERGTPTTDQTAQRPAQGSDANIRRQEQEIQEKIERVESEVRQSVETKQNELEQQNARNNQSPQSGSPSQAIVWPFQNIPTVNGLSKEVNWGSSKQTITFAEPIIPVDGGAGSIEIEVEFKYAVGVPGLGPDGLFPWSVEEIMGMIYLATSLVYPYQSVSIGVAQAANRESDGESVEDEERPQAQFPVLFLRHYSLFPYLTPFVCKSVSVEPDEEQPLIITEPSNRFGQIQSHLELPAIRQTVSIKLNLISAHFYLPAFGEDEDGSIQRQTSGKTYLELAYGLAGNRLGGQPNNNTGG